MLNIFMLNLKYYLRVFCVRSPRLLFKLFHCVLSKVEHILICIYIDLPFLPPSFLSTVRSCWEWESKMRSIIALVIFILGCYYFEPYMIPGIAVLILLKYYLVRRSCIY